MTLDASGNLAVGTTSPLARLHGEGTGTQLRLTYSGVASYNFKVLSPNAFTIDQDGTERLRIDSSGNLLINRTSTVNGAKVMVSAPASGVAYGIEWADSVYMSQMRFSADYYVGVLASAATRELRLEANSADSTSKITFYTGASGTTSERARIDSSGAFIFKASSGSTTLANSDTAFVPDAGYGQYLVLGNTYGSGKTYVTFKYNATGIGTIAANSTSSVAYNTTSDYRLKENIFPMTGALAKITALKPCTYTWKLDGSSSQGFIAHELAEIVPECVTGAKDAVDAEGNPKYQGIDTSFLVATLTAAIQEQQALIETLTQRITALEGR
jgi:hypothetical protein